MIPVPGGVRVWLATGATDMRRGMNTLALQVQEDLGHDPHAGDLYIFRGRRGDLVKILWHDGVGISLYAKRLERGRFLADAATGGLGLAAGVGLEQLVGFRGGLEGQAGEGEVAQVHHSSPFLNLRMASGEGGGSGVGSPGSIRPEG